METSTKPKKKGILDFKNLSQEEKQKYGAFAVFGLVFCGIMYYGISNYTTDDKNDEVTEFSNPESEQSKYNSKLEALNPKDIPQSSNSLEYTFKETENTNAETNSNNVDLASLDKQLSEIGKTSNSNQNKSSSNTYTSSSSSNGNSNSHSVYGNYDMWTSKEPSNSQIGYNSKRNVPTTTSQPKPVKQQNYEVIEQDYSTSSYTPVQNESKAQVRNSKQIQASLLSKGFATNGRSLSFVLLEPFSYKGESIKKGQVLVGSATVDDDRIFVKFTNGKFNGKTLPLSGFITGIDGAEGLPISSVESSREAGENVKNEVLNQSTRIPVVGGVVRSVQNMTRKSNSSSTSNKVYLTENTKCTINIYE